MRINRLIFQILQKLTALGSITAVWNDDFLKWNETKFGAVTRMHMSKDEIWQPHLQHMDENDDYHLIHRCGFTATVQSMVYSQGDLCSLRL